MPAVRHSSFAASLAFASLEDWRTPPRLVFAEDEGVCSKVETLGLARMTRALSLFFAEAFRLFSQTPPALLSHLQEVLRGARVLSACVLERRLLEGLHRRQPRSDFASPDTRRQALCEALKKTERETERWLCGEGSGAQREVCVSISAKELLRMTASQGTGNCAAEDGSRKRPLSVADVAIRLTTAASSPPSPRLPRVEAELVSLFALLYKYSPTAAPLSCQSADAAREPREAGGVARVSEGSLEVSENSELWKTWSSRATKCLFEGEERRLSWLASCKVHLLDLREPSHSLEKGGSLKERRSREAILALLRSGKCSLLQPLVEKHRIFDGRLGTPVLSRRRPVKISLAKSKDSPKPPSQTSAPDAAVVGRAAWESVFRLLEAKGKTAQRRRTGLTTSPSNCELPQRLPAEAAEQDDALDVWIIAAETSESLPLSLAEALLCEGNKGCSAVPPAAQVYVQLLRRRLPGEDRATAPRLAECFLTLSL